LIVNSKILKNQKQNNITTLFDFENLFQTLRDVYHISIMRSLMNQLINKIYFKGKVLDIGGGRKSNYINFLKYDEYTSININPNIYPDILIKVNENFPIKNKLYDQCLLFNVLEHIYDWEFLFGEIKKVLKKNGTIHIIIPFLYPIHGSPDDYKRVTHQYIQKFLEKHAYSQINIVPLSYGPFTNSQLIGYRHKFINGPISQISVIADKLFHTIFMEKYFSYNEKCPLFYYIKANHNV